MALGMIVWTQVLLPFAMLVPTVVALLLPITGPARIAVFMLNVQFLGSPVAGVALVVLAIRAPRERPPSPPWPDHVPWPEGVGPPETNLGTA